MEKIKAKNKTIKLISTLLIISVLVPSVLFSNPKKAEAVWWSTWLSDVWNGITSGSSTSAAISSGANASTNATQLGIKIREVAKEVWKETLKAVARRALQEMTKSTINWINSGFHGSPLFLENPESFFEDIAKSEVKNMVDTFGYDSLKYPFGKAFALNTINAYKNTLENNTAYSLSKVINDPVALRNYQNNFDYGGWNAFLVNTQYPQNNYLGFQITATEELTRRIQGTTAEVQTALAQGQGFLSPQACPSNPDYNNGKNEWNRPSFDQAAFDKEHENDDPDRYEYERKKALAEWAETNDCPGGLVNTTPGSVVSNQIMNALGSGQRQGELSAAMGNSMSAIFDALLNKFISEGLNSLASKVNPPPDNEDTWSYDGQTLGSPSDGGTNSTWDMGPEEPIYINKFKEDIKNGITNTETEIQLISKIINKLNEIWPKARTLDICLPGPDVNWEQRLEDEKNKADGRIQKGFSSGSDKQIDEGEKVKKELKFAVNFFKDWIINKMMSELPSSILYMDAVKDIQILSQESNQITDEKRAKIQVLARLKSIQGTLEKITELDDKGNIIQPEPGSANEKILIKLKKQYDATRTLISNTISVGDKQNELLIKEEQLSNLDDLITKCEAERKVKGWGTPGGATSSYNGPSTAVSGLNPEIDGIAINSEQAMFCNLPIVGGYNHETFINQTGTTHPEIPMINAKKVLKYKILTIGSMLTFSKKTAYVNIKLNCNNIFRANILDYKGNLPGLTNIIEISNPLPDNDEEGTGTCDFSDGIEEQVTEEYCSENGGTWTRDIIIDTPQQETTL